jgi:hypothetical protein
VRAAPHIQRLDRYEARQTGAEVGGAFATDVVPTDERGIEIGCKLDTPGDVESLTEIVKHRPVPI